MRVTIPDEVVVRDLAGEMILLHLGTGIYFGLDSVGTRLWQFLDQDRTTEAAVRRILQEYEIDERQLNQDCMALVELLIEKQLLIAHSD